MSIRGTSRVIQSEGMWYASVGGRLFGGYAMRAYAEAAIPVEEDRLRKRSERETRMSLGDAIGIADRGFA